MLVTLDPRATAGVDVPGAGSDGWTWWRFLLCAGSASLFAIWRPRSG